jgi:hypothetical protein
MNMKRYLLVFLLSAFSLFSLPPLVHAASTVWCLKTDAGKVIPLKYVSYVQKNATDKRLTIVKKSGDVVANVVTVTFVQSADYTPGDVDDDGTISVVDVTKVVQYILGTANDTFNKEAADLNGDGVVNVVDVTLIINKILNR